ncbi:MAG: TolC family protein [Deltaproteobacteria bacterium]|nr:TolC family protein [Deltaproteobacteria bacterium]MBW2415679.1 TolC family protein [Deltaproteobacteria bacterium]
MPLLFIPVAVHAQPLESPAGELTLAGAIAAALAANPDLRAGEFELRAGAGRVEQAGLRPNPELALEAENFAGTGDAAATHALESTLILSQVIELGGKRERRVQVASAGYETLTVERQIRQLDVLAEVMRRYMDVVVAQERLSLGHTSLDLANDTLSIVARRVKAARAPRAEQSRATIARARTRLDLGRAQQTLEAARWQLAATWGGEEPRFTRAVGDLYALAAVQEFDTLAARLESTPDFLRYAADRRLHEAELALARARARPSLKLSAGLRRLNESHDTALVAGVSLPIPLFDRRQGRRTESRARIAQSEAERAAALVRARATVFALHGELGVARVEVGVLRGEVIRQAEGALDQVRSGFERGRFSYLELAAAQQDVLDALHAAIDAAAAFHRLHTEIERLTGEPLAAAAP